jgi:hypothetical protein
MLVLIIVRYVAETEGCISMIDQEVKSELSMGLMKKFICLFKKEL